MNSIRLFQPILALIILACVHSARASVDQYEYFVISGENLTKNYQQKDRTMEDAIILALNKLGKDGWKLDLIDRRPSNSDFLLGFLRLFSLA